MRRPPDRADIAVIGAGVAGLSTARLVAEAGASVVVFEAARVGAGAAGLGLGHVLAGVVEHPYRVIDALGVAAARRLYADTAKSGGLLRQWGLADSDLLPWIALDERETEEVERSARALEALGVRAEVVDPAQVAVTTGLGSAGAALLVGGTGSVDPMVGLQRLREAVVAASGIVVEQVPVLAVVDGADGLRVQLQGHNLHCEVVVYAAGVGVLTLDRFFEGKVVPVREQALSLPARERVATAARAGFGYTFWRQAASALHVGGCRWATPHLETGETEPVTVPTVQSRIEGFGRRLVPEGRVGRRWAWIEAHSCDGLPIVGPLPGSARHLACVGFCGNDWGLAPAAAQAIADGLLGEGAHSVEPLFAATRFTT